MDKIIDIPPADLLIDTQNPRIPESNNSQQQALFALAKHLGSKLYFTCRGHSHEWPGPFQSPSSNAFSPQITVGMLS